MKQSKITPETLVALTDEALSALYDDADQAGADLYLEKDAYETEEYTAVQSEISAACALIEAEIMKRSERAELEQAAKAHVEWAAAHGGKQSPLLRERWELRESTDGFGKVPTNEETGEQCACEERVWLLDGTALVCTKCHADLT